MTMNPRRIAAVFLRYWFLLTRTPQRFFQIIIWGALDVILWGFITKYLATLGVANFGVLSAFLGGAVFLDFIARAHQGTSTPALEDIWSNNLFNYFASPLRIGEYILGLVAASIFTSTVSVTVMVVMAFLIFGFSITALGPPLFGFLLILFIFGVSLGILGVTIVLRFGPSGEWYVWPMTALLSPFVGVFYPISVLPEWMQSIALALPPSYVFEGMRSIILNGTFDLSTLFIGGVLSIVYVVVAYVIFLKVYKSVVRSGLLAHHSAEGL